MSRPNLVQVPTRPTMGCGPNYKPNSMEASKTSSLETQTSDPNLEIVSSRPSLVEGLSHLQTTHQLTNYLKEIIESQIYPSWCGKAPLALQTWAERIVQDGNSKCGNYLSMLLTDYISHFDASAVYSVMPLHMQLNNLIDNDSRINSDHSLWQNVYMLHMSLHKANPMCFQSYLVILGKNFLDSITDSTVTFLLRLLRLKALILMLDSTPEDCRTTVKVTNTHVISDLLTALREAGDYDFQASIIEVIFYLTSTSERQTDVNSWFPSLTNDIQELFLSIADFVPDCRKFLLAYNEALGGNKKVFTYPCLAAKFGNYYLRKPKIPTYEHLWIDFNIKSITLSILFDRLDPNDASSERCAWEIIKINEQKIESADLITKINGYSLVLKLSEDPVNYFNYPPPQTYRDLLNKELNIDFPLSAEYVEELCLILFNDKLQVSSQETTIAKPPSEEEISKNMNSDAPSDKKQRLLVSNMCCSDLASNQDTEGLRAEQKYTKSASVECSMDPEFMIKELEKKISQKLGEILYLDNKCSPEDRANKFSWSNKYTAVAEGLEQLYTTLCELGCRYELDLGPENICDIIFSSLNEIEKNVC